MKSSKLIEILQDNLRKYGDCEVVSNDGIQGCEPITGIQVDKPYQSEEIVFYICDHNISE